MRCAALSHDAGPGLLDALEAHEIAEVATHAVRDPFFRGLPRRVVLRSGPVEARAYDGPASFVAAEAAHDGDVIRVRPQRFVRLRIAFRERPDRRVCRVECL